MDPRAATGPDLRQVPYADAFHATHAAIRRNWTSARLADTYALPFGETSGRGITEYMIVETLGHGWTWRSRPVSRSAWLPILRKRA
jgi:hypothetical protein